MSGLWLNEDELYELTGFRQRNRQKQALAAMRIPFRSREADGYPLVERSQFTAAGSPQRRREPNFRLRTG
jgi:hypothetical protein